MSFSSSYDFIDLLQNSLSFSTHIFFRLRLDSFKIVRKALVIVIFFFIFQRNNPFVYTEKIRIRNNKKEIPIFNLLISYNN